MERRDRGQDDGARSSGARSVGGVCANPTNTPVKRILLVDDDTPLRHSLAEQLRLDDGFETEVAETAAAALAKVRDGHFDAILLDAGLPDMDGGDLCRVMRDEGVRSPVILLTAADTTVGLDSGASDSVTKPFRLGVLLARLRAQLRQFERRAESVFAIGPYSFRPAARLLLEEPAGRKIRLTEKEVAILHYLHRAGGKAVGRDMLLGEVWGYNAGVTTHTLETHVYRLRRKIEADPSNARLLLTESGGYRLAS